MEKLKMESLNMTQCNIEKIGALFPQVITEAVDDNGKLVKVIDFEKLRQELSSELLGDGEESYDFTWVGKNQAIVEANEPIRKTLRPVVETETVPTGEDSKGNPYCSSGSKNFDTTENLYIEGDNLDVLKLLQESYLNSIKMIYIDPPYNTGKDSFVYPDNYTMAKDDYEEQIEYRNEDGEVVFKQNNETNERFHSDWCSMIYMRLRLAKNLLADDGVIFISIDDNEVENLKKLCDEIFGASNFVAQLVKVGNSAKNNVKQLSISHEYCLVYAKMLQSLPIWKMARTNATEFQQRANKLLRAGLVHAEIQKELRALVKYPRFYDFDHYVYCDRKGVFRANDLTAPNSKNYFDIIHPKTHKACKIGTRGWAYSKDAIDELVAADKILFGDDELTMPQLKCYLEETLTQSPRAVLFFDSQTDTKWIKSNQLGFDFPKPIEYIKHLIEISTVDKEDIVLDFFSGSGTTAHAVMKLNAEDGGNRKFICVQLPEVTDDKSEASKAGLETICEIGKERIRRAGEKIKAETEESNARLEIGEEPKQVPDIGFRVLKLDSTNMKDVYYGAEEITQTILGETLSNIKEDRTGLDLLYGVLLDWGLELSSSCETLNIDGVTVYNYDDASLVACLEDKKVSEVAIREIAKMQPTRVVFRDSSFESSSDKINVEEIFKLTAPGTSVRVI